MIGVLGGMGPAATVDFMAKLVRLTPAERDQDHVPVIVVADPTVPDRVAPILEGRGPSPLDAMRRGVRKLQQAGAQCVAIPCHTAHFWYEKLAADTTLPILHIVDAVLAELERQSVPKGPIGLLATAATLEAAFYQQRLEAAGYACVLPTAEVMAERVLPAIALVKQDRAREAAPLVEAAIEALTAAGAPIVVLACTELPVAADAAEERPEACLDATEALARACIQWHQHRLSTLPGP